MIRVAIVGVVLCAVFGCSSSTSTAHATCEQAVEHLTKLGNKAIEADDMTQRARQRRLDDLAARTATQHQACKGGWSSAVLACVVAAKEEAAAHVCIEPTKNP
jgi:hypothetical protein